jgi:integrase
MARPRALKPAYCVDTATQRAFVTINGRKRYLGKPDTQESRDAYDRIIGEWIAAGRRQLAATNAADVDPGPSVATVCAAFWEHVQGYHAGDVGKSQRDHYRAIIRILVRLYGQPTDRAAAFGPLALEVVRTEMVGLGWCRKYINAQIGRVRRIFKWAVGRELVAAPVWQALQAVEGLKRGRTKARESESVKPVPDAYIDAVLPCVSSPVRGMIELQLVTGMRPGEVCPMRRRDLDTTGRLWTYRPATHKNAHRGHDRTIYLGPRAQELLRPFLKPELDAYLFSPAAAEAERREKLTAARETPDSCGNTVGSNRTPAPNRSPGSRYNVGTYRRAIRYACDRAFPPPADLARRRAPLKTGRKSARLETKAEWRTRLGPEKWAELRRWLADHRWHPHQLRHNAATRLRKEYGLEAAQVILGHETLSVTEIYAEKNVAAAMRIMSEVG